MLAAYYFQVLAACVYIGIACRREGTTSEFSRSLRLQQLASNLYLHAPNLGMGLCKPWSPRTCAEASARLELEGYLLVTAIQIGT
jgi:hypothetical protein